MTNPPPQQGSFTMSASGSTVSVAQGANGTVTLTITRSGSFTGAVGLSVTGLPSGVTGAFSPAQVATGQAASILTITAASAAATGTASITVRGTGTGVADQTVSIQVTVTTTAPPQPGAFSLSTSATSFLFYPSNQLQQHACSLGGSAHGCRGACRWCDLPDGADGGGNHSVEW